MHMEIISILDNERLTGSMKIICLSSSVSDNIPSVTEWEFQRQMKISRKWLHICGKEIMKRRLKY